MNVKFAGFELARARFAGVAESKLRGTSQRWRNLCAGYERLLDDGYDEY